MILTKRDRKQLIRLLGEYQGLLEASIDCNQPPSDAEDRQQLNRDKTRWAEADESVTS